MRRSPSIQCDLFGSDPSVPALASLQLHHDELVELLSRLLWEVASGVNETPLKDDHDEQDQP
jgi:hypothetical protein